MHLLAPVETMSHVNPIRVVVVGASSELESKLSSRGLIVVTIDVTEQMVKAIAESKPNIILLSKAIGARTAVLLCRALKERQSFCRVPVVFYGHGDEPATENAAFAAGADDYVPRIVPPATIRARIQAILRRFSRTDLIDESEPKPLLQIGEIQVMSESYVATVSDRIVPLTVGEFRVLWKLAKNVDKTLSAEELLPTSMDTDGPSPDRSVRSHVWSLRRKLGRLAGSQIQTVRNAGYRLSARTG